jgi:ribosome maturation factor RimP
MANAEMTLNDRLASLIIAMGYEFVGSELLKQGRFAVLRIFIDAEQGIKLEDCSRVSRQVSAMLDVDDPIQGQYTLEVSSPGLDRPLFNIEHYQKFIGSQAKVRLSALLNGRRKFTGLIVRVEGMDIHFLVDTVEIVVPFFSIEKANVIADNRV